MTPGGTREPAPLPQGQPSAAPSRHSQSPERNGGKGLLQYGWAGFLSRGREDAAPLASPLLRLQSETPVPACQVRERPLLPLPRRERGVRVWSSSPALHPSLLGSPSPARTSLTSKARAPPREPSTAPRHPVAAAGQRPGGRQQGGTRAKAPPQAPELHTQLAPATGVLPPAQATATPRSARHAGQASWLGCEA